MPIVGFVGILPYKMCHIQSINFGGFTVELVIIGFSYGLAFCGLFFIFVTLVEGLVNRE